MKLKSSNRSGRRGLFTALAAVIALSGALIPEGIALAESPGDIAGTAGSLTIHKHAGTPGSAGSSKEIADPSALGVGLGGVEFTVSRVTFDDAPIDLTTAAGWNLAKHAVTPLGTRFGSTPISQGVAVTDANGVVSVGGIPYGLYLVTETSAGPRAVVAPAEPFLVTVPYPNSTTGGWITDVHVYPKNQLVDTTTLSVSDPTTPLLGASVTWTIAANAPRLAVGQNYSRFEITDQLDSRLKFTSASVKRDGVTLSEGLDYVLTPPTPQNGSTVMIAPRLGSIRTGQDYEVQITTKVTGPGEIVNRAKRMANDEETLIGPVQTNWGALSIVNRVEGSENTLRGARFELTAADRNTWLMSEREAGRDGTIAYPGLWVGNGEKKVTDYCVRATRAPAGYLLPADPWTCKAVTSSEPSTPVEWVIFNARMSGLPLPLTGAGGTATLLAGGGVLVLSAAAWAVLAARRRARA